jgi:anti-sigma-K factor RskA
LALAAVGALTDEERSELDDVLRGRPDLQAELDELRAATAVLADAVGDTPPPMLRASVLEAIARTPQLPAEEAAPAAAPPVAPVAPIGAARRRRHRWVAIGSAAAAVIAIVVGVLIVSPWAGEETDDEVAAVIESPDAVEIPMPGELVGVTIIHSASEDAAVLLADQVPVPQGNRVYELWAIRDGTPQSFATFRPNEDGQLRIYAAGLDPASAQQWAITEEQAGGSPTGQPTSAILASTAT